MQAVAEVYVKFTPNTSTQRVASFFTVVQGAMNGGNVDTSISASEYHSLDDMLPSLSWGDAAYHTRERADLSKDDDVQEDSAQAAHKPRCA